MSRIEIPSVDDAPEESRSALASIRKQMGVVPNLFRLLAKSPAALSGFLGLQGALRRSFDAKTRERIALAVAQVNGCDYCMSAHSYLALNVAKLPPEEIARNRRGTSSDPKAAAIVGFATRVAEKRGHVTDQELAEARAQGLSDAELIEVVALVVDNSFSNYLNEVARTDIDFPVVHANDDAA